MEKYHSDLKASIERMYETEKGLVSLAARDPYFLNPLAKIIYHSGREIDDSFMFYKSALAKDIDFESILATVPRLLFRDGQDDGLIEELKDKEDITEACGFLMMIVTSLIMLNIPDSYTNEVEGENAMTNETTAITTSDNVTTKGRKAFKLSAQNKDLNAVIFNLNEKIDAMHEDAYKEIGNTIKSIVQMQPNSSDYPKLYDYLTFCSELSFGQDMTEEDIDADEVRAKMDETHYGLNDAKDRIIEQLAVNKLNADANAPRFLMVGGAGTGKTSLANSIGKALGRKVQRVALGGMKDVTTIKGHGRTYLGAKAGVIMNAIMKAGVDNPVLILDEVDKMGEVGSAESTLLELLDPEQNVGFVDNYLNFPYDLSKVMMICTANYPQLVDAPVLDRLEVIPTEGYLLSEKIKIASDYVMPKKLKALGLKEENIKITKPTIKFIVEGYTREPGVRRLEQTIEKVLRGSILDVLKDRNHVTKVTKAVVRKRLGEEVFGKEEALKHEAPGIATGLYYNGIGGGAAQMECVFTRNAGEFKMTGEAGSMLRNSFEVAKTVVDNLNGIIPVDVDILDEVGLHGQMGDGSTPVDGPSAGILFTTSLVSLLMDVPVKDKLAMTGEIFLSGRVGAIGGLEEKIPGGYRCGMREFIVPKACERQLKDVPKEILKKVKIHCVSHIDEVLEIAFDLNMKEARKAFDDLVAVAEGEDETIETVVAP